MGKLINIDNGGTLTDVCVFDGEQVFYAKTLTTPFDLGLCFFESLRGVSRAIYGDDRVADLLHSTDYIRYSTTQGTNALVERKGPKLGLLLDSAAFDTEPGVEDERALRDVLVGDRIEIVTDESGATIVNAVARLAARGASRIVVAFDGDDFAARERATATVLLKSFPRHLLGSTPYLLSHELTGDHVFRRRVWTGLFNAFLHPSMERFLYNSESRLRDFRTSHPLQIFRNDGGASRVAKTVALKTYSSGPRGGLAGAAALAQRYDIERVLMFDVGGTTTDIAAVTHGQIPELPHGVVEGIVTSFPLAHVRSFGIGGSSIAVVADGKLRIGPESVGANPGPACFGFGGREATITDALLLLGLFDPATYFDGSLRLDIGRAKAAISQNIAEPLGIDVTTAALRLRDHYHYELGKALHAQADDVSCATLVAFGGAGPMSACGAAEQAGIARVIVPKTAAVFSAFGIGFCDVSQRYDAAVASTQVATLAPARDALLERARRDMFGEGIPFDECTRTFTLFVERGDVVEEIPLDESMNVGEVIEPGSFTLRLEVRKAISMGRTMRKASLTPTHAAVSANRRTFIDRPGSAQDLPIYALADIAVGATATGPCIIEDKYFTFDIPSDWRAVVASEGDLVVEHGVTA